MLTNAHAAALYLFGETTASSRQALPFLQVAQSQLAYANDREQLYVNAIAAWADRDLDRALAYHETLTDRYPRDLISVFIAQYHYFFRGDNWALLKLIEKILPANQEKPLRPWDAGVCVRAMLSVGGSRSCRATGDTDVPL